VVVGAGPAGSATAIELASRGHRVTLVDRAVFPRPKPCSEYLNPRAVSRLAALGILPALRAAGAQPLRGSQVFSHRGGQLSGDFAASAPGAGLAVPRFIMDALLVDAARRAGVTVLERMRVRSASLRGGIIHGVTVEEQSGATRFLSARLVIGADGLRSTIARQIGTQRYGRPARLAFVAHLPAPDWLAGHAQMHLGASGYVGLNRVGPALANVALVVPQQRAGAARGDATGFFFDQLSRYPRLVQAFRASDLIAPVLVTGPFAARATQVIADGALLVGDAAEFFDPFTGEGIARALHDAALAAETVHQALDTSTGVIRQGLLRDYARTRRSAHAGKWAIERLVGFGMLLPALFDRAVRRLERRGMAHTFVGVTADLLPARAVLNPWFLSRMVL
ncbi:MAG TPA: FAD-dependent oxidoreductase, partial [Gemmatimonadales bacterium]|nr:FAD-dependent oxidoreductase [Gemmatimonadales bacterium]